MADQITGVEPEAEEMMVAFPKNPVVCADIHSIAISLKRIADAVCGSPTQSGIFHAIFDISNRPNNN